jgi:hypothetical protein
VVGQHPDRGPDRAAEQRRPPRGTARGGPAGPVVGPVRPSALLAPPLAPPARLRPGAGCRARALARRHSGHKAINGHTTNRGTHQPRCDLRVPTRRWRRPRSGRRADAEYIPCHPWGSQLGHWWDAPERSRSPNGRSTNPAPGW